MNINLDIVLYFCGAIVTIASAIAIVTKIINNTIKKTSREVIEQYMIDCNKESNDKIEKLTNMLEEHINNSNSSNNNIRNTLLSQARLQINQIYDKYIDSDTIDPYTLSSVISLYNSYTSLGGNSFVENEINYLRSLKVTNREID